LTNYWEIGIVLLQVVFGIETIRDVLYI